MSASVKKPWVAPFLSPHSMGAFNKFGLRARQDYQDHIEGVAVEQLTQEFGSPLFVTSERQLRCNVRRLTEAFRQHYPDVVHGWSYKTNYTSAICNILHQEGSWAEVVSRFEYE